MSIARRSEIARVKKALGSSLLKELNLELNRNSVIILPKKVDFDTALLEGLSRLRVKPENTIIFGCGENDVDLFNISGYKVAFPDSACRVKELADEIMPYPPPKGLLEALGMLTQD